MPLQGATNHLVLYIGYQNRIFSDRHNTRTFATFHSRQFEPQQNPRLIYDYLFTGNSQGSCHPDNCNLRLSAVSDHRGYKLPLNNLFPTLRKAQPSKFP